MKKLFILLIVFVVFSSHDMYLKLDTYFLEPNTSAIIKLFNGTFDKSENPIDRNRMIDVSLVGNGSRHQVDTAQWGEKDNMTILSFQSGESATWVAGVSTGSRSLEMAAEDFNSYLEHDGVVDLLEWRKENNAMGNDAVEKYSKHVKAIFQVGDKKTEDWQTPLGFPIEFIPLKNPYDLHAGHDIEVKLLWQGKPLTNQLITVDSEVAEQGHGHEHSTETASQHSHEPEDTTANDQGDDHEHGPEGGEDHHHNGITQVRTDANGNFTVNLSSAGIWYLRKIYLIHSEESGLTHESNWATLTFEVGEGDGHSHGEEEHSNTDTEDHDHAQGGIPSYVFWIGSLLLIGGLFFWFSRKRE